MSAHSHDGLFADLEARGIQRAKIGGFDVDGVLRGKYVSLEKLRSALKSGFGFCDVIFGWDIADVLYDNARVTGWHTGYPDAHAVLDPSTAREVPWEPGTLAVLADFRDGAGGPHPACPRSLLRTVIARAERMGYTPKLACEFEFFIFKESPTSLHDKRFSNLTPLSPGMFGYSWVREGQNKDLMTAIFDGMRAFDIEVEGLHTETGPGVYEVAIRYDDALRAADKAALFKVAMKQIAFERGLSVTFMAKWNASLPGSSGHLHQSLWRDGQNAFTGPADQSGISRTMRHYIGGQLALMRELTALVSPTVNSYKRYVPGVWAPLTATWGFENRTTALRIVGAGTDGARVEVRQAAADINPYIAMAATLGAGLYGIENEIEPPPHVVGDAGEGGPERSRLPRSLAEATALLAESQKARQIFGEGFIDHYVRTREWEVRQYERAVSDWELARYFEAI
ncbi:glutamine synthetase family protein [Polyangium aurulentum]|uniref:glutamine synthetase family protein n=1 Tax=Polyangium aurulentum TaxID=2567896 RepID=UPI0010AE706F|nr:glutamine synthetase family protein [Polyangium aurulentum]UQA56639.1 glutamine synthetase family protein [Polyangium aurulentum]